MGRKVGLALLSLALVVPATASAKVAQVAGCVLDARRPGSFACQGAFVRFPSRSSYLHSTHCGR